MIRSRLCVAVAIAAIVSVGSCGDSSEDSVGTEPAPSEKRASSEPTTATEAPVTPRKDSCKLRGSKATAVLKDDVDEVVLTFKGEPVRSSGTTGFYAMVYDAHGEIGGQVGAKFLDGKPIAYFTALDSSGSQMNLPGEPSVKGSTVRLTFPKAITELGDFDIAKWNAAFTVEGADVGMCPGDFKTQPFAQ